MAIKKAAIAKAVKQAFKATGDIPILVDYVSVTPGAYDPLTDTVATTEVTISDLMVINTKLKEQEIDWFPTDINTQRLLIAALDMGTTVPKVDDYVLIGSTRWEVRRVNQVPGGSLYIVFVQEP